MIGKGSIETYLDDAAVLQIIGEAIEAIPNQHSQILIIIPDGARTAPTPLMSEFFSSCCILG